MSINDPSIPKFYTWSPIPMLWSPIPCFWSQSQRKFRGLIPDSIYHVTSLTIVRVFLMQWVHGKAWQCESKRFYHIGYKCTILDFIIIILLFIYFILFFLSKFALSCYVTGVLFSWFLRTFFAGTVFQS